jgi:adenylyltransferase/sulfurtransferase
MSLSEEQIERYSRHILLPDVGGVGQKRLLAAIVAVDLGPDRLIEGAAIAYLAAAGVGHLLLGGDARGPLTDAEVACGILYGLGDVGRPRVDAIRDRVLAINPDVSVSRADDPDTAHRVDAQLPRVAIDGEVDLPGALIHGGAAAVRTITELIRRPG